MERTMPPPPPTRIVKYGRVGAELRIPNNADVQAWQYQDIGGYTDNDPTDGGGVPGHGDRCTHRGPVPHPHEAVRSGGPEVGRSPGLAPAWLPVYAGG